MSGEFRKVFDKSINDFKSNFPGFVKLGLLVYFIPVLIVGFVPLLVKNISSIVVSSLFINIVVMIASLFYMTFMIKTLNKDKGNLLSFSWKKLPSVILFNVVYTLLLFVLLLGLIVPAIIFGVFWVFGLVIFILSEKKGIMDSLKESKGLVQGRWWKTVGYFLLFGLIIMLFYFAVMIVLYSIGGILGKGIGLSILGVVFDSFASLVMTMVSAIFTFNLYQHYKSKYSKKESPKKVLAVKKTPVAKKVAKKK